MESDKRNQQTYEDLTDAKLTIHRKFVGWLATTLGHYARICRNYQK